MSAFSWHTTTLVTPSSFLSRSVFSVSLLFRLKEQIGQTEGHHQERSGSSRQSESPGSGEEVRVEGCCPRFQFGLLTLRSPWAGGDTVAEWTGGEGTVGVL